MENSMNKTELLAWWEAEATKHSDYTMQSLAVANDNNMKYSLECVMFHYNAALIHGFKHGIEADKPGPPVEDCGKQ